MKTILFFGLLALASAFVDPLSQESIDQINDMETTWKAGRSFPLGTSRSSLRRLAGVLPDPEGTKKLVRRSNKPEGFDIPASFDAREQWPDCPAISEIRDQGNCGSCWAVAAASVMSDRACIHSEGKENFRYSSDNLVACCTACGFGCEGGWLGPAFDYWISTGIVSGGTFGSKEGCQPYTIPPTGFLKTLPTPECKADCIPEYDTPYELDLHFATESYMVSQDQSEIQYEIMTNGPVEVSFDVYDDFYMYTSGIYQHLIGDYAGGHAVRIIGWGEEGGVPYWILANSWNYSWGEDGFFRMLRGADECFIESDVHGGVPRPV